MNRIQSIITVLILCFNQVNAQNGLSLNEVLQTAQKQSLDAFRTQNMYLASYWEYQSYKSRQLPHLDWYINPVNYNRRMVARYDYGNNIEVYRQQQTLSSYTGLSLSQNIAATGGKLFIESDIYRLQNFGAENVNSWSSTPFRIGFEQPIMGYNRFKWEKKISPLNYERAKQQYIQNQQQTNKKAVLLYFNLILAKARCDMAAHHVATADTLYFMGKKRFEIASIQMEELLDLELSMYNSAIRLAQAEKDLEKARFNLNSFLGFDKQTVIEPVLPPTIEGLQIDAQWAVELAQKLNPGIIGYRQKQLEAERQLEQTEKNSRFSANLSASYGLNQSAGTFDKVYRNPLDQQMVGLSVSVPLLDWGDSKGRRQMALNQKEVVDIEVKQSMIDFEQEVNLKVIDFNLQAREVWSAAKADTLAGQSFELTKKRFVLGKADVLKLTSSMSAQQQASERYINSLATYWRFLYEVQELTLYDFINKKTLEADFEDLVNSRK